MIEITSRAADVIREIMKREYPDKEYALRIQIVPGGCSGISYQLMLDDEISHDDAVFDSAGLKVVVDPHSYPYLQGALIDFVETQMGQGFVIQNPNFATEGCGCGSGGCGCGADHHDEPPEQTTEGCGCGQAGCGRGGH